MNSKSIKSWGSIFFIISFSIFINSCYTIVDKDKLRTNNHPAENNNPIDSRNNIPNIQEVSGNGVVTYVIPGSTPEIKSHAGYVLRNPEWEIAPEDERKPDLIISSIFSERKMNKRHHYPGGTPQRYTPERPSFEYRITVMNIGEEIVADPFYVVWGSVGAGVIKPKYSEYVLVNRERNIIPIDGSIEIKLTFGDNEGRKFLVNPQNIEYYPFIPESNYDNNTYLY